MVRKIAAVVVLLLMVVAALATAGEKIYRYRTTDGKVEVGTDVPAGATIIKTVGEIDSGRRSGPIVDLGEVKSLATTDLERVVRAMQAEPIVTGIFVLIVFFWSVLVLRAFPPIFTTLELDLVRAQRMVLSILAGCFVLLIFGYALEWLWVMIGWSPLDELGRPVVDAIGWALYGLVAVVVFCRRLGVGLIQATILCFLWLLIVVGFGLALWIFAVPWVVAQLHAVS